MGFSTKFCKITPDDPTDEWLSSQGINIIKIKTFMNNNPYAAVHHKFAIIDNTTVLTGAYNWASYSLVSDDDLAVIKNINIANRYLEEYNYLLNYIK